MVHVAEGSVIIYRPVTHVWAHIIVAQSVPTWLPGCFAVKSSDPAGTLREGTSVSGQATFMGVETTWSAKVRKSDEPKFVSTRFTVTAPRGECDGGCEVTLEPVADGEVGIARFVDLSNVDSAVAVLTQDLVRRTQGGIELLGRRKSAPPRGCSLPYEGLISGHALTSPTSSRRAPRSPG